MNMVDFWNFRHYKYFIIGHLLLASKCCTISVLCGHILKVNMVKIIVNKRLIKNILCMFPDTNGFQPARIAHELTWERVANLTGGGGKNIGLDLLNEYLNNEFKGTL